MTREEKMAILKDIIDGEIINPQVRKDVGEWAIEALEQLPKLQNRCHALTHGLICVFCPYECEHKAEIEPQEREGV